MNLLPPKIIEARKAHRIKIYLYGLQLAIIMLALGAIPALNLTSNRLANDIDDINQQIQHLMATDFESAAAVNRQMLDYQESIRFMYLPESNFVAEDMAFAINAAPAALVIQNARYHSNQINITGYALDIGLIHAYMDALFTRFYDVALAGITFGEGAFQYGITIQL